MTTVLLAGGDDQWPAEMAKAFPITVNLLPLQRKGVLVSELVEAILREVGCDGTDLPADACVALVMSQRCGLDDVVQPAEQAETVDQPADASPLPLRQATLFTEKNVGGDEDGCCTTVVLPPGTIRAAVPVADYLFSDKYECQCIVMSSWRSVCRSEGWSDAPETAGLARRADRSGRTKSAIAGGTPRLSSTTSGAEFSPAATRKRTRSSPSNDGTPSAVVPPSGARDHINSTRRVVLPSSPEAANAMATRATERRVATTYDLQQLNAWAAAGIIAPEHCPASLRCPVCDAVFTSPVVVGCCCATQCAACAAGGAGNGAKEAVVKCATCGEERRSDDVVENGQVAATVEQWRREVSVIYQREPPSQPQRPPQSHLLHPSAMSMRSDARTATELFPRMRRGVPGAGLHPPPLPMMSAQPPVLEAPFPLPAPTGAHWQPSVAVGGRQLPPPSQYPRYRRQ